MTCTAFINPLTLAHERVVLSTSHALSQAVPKYAGRFHKGSTHGLRAFGIAKLLEVKAASNSKGNCGGSVPKSIKVQRFFRPEDVSRDLAYSSGLYDVLAPPSGAGSWVQWVDVGYVVGKCAVVGADQVAGEASGGGASQWHG